MWDWIRKTPQESNKNKKEVDEARKIIKEEILKLRVSMEKGQLKNGTN